MLSENFKGMLLATAPKANVVLEYAKFGRW
jgi:hypothetical protein